jgi:hypothetical protein
VVTWFHNRLVGFRGPGICHSQGQYTASHMCTTSRTLLPRVCFELAFPGFERQAVRAVDRVAIMVGRFVTAY